MKSYTDIEQSRKLMEILPIESADMWFHPYPNDEYWYDIPNIGIVNLRYNQLPCWSLAALLTVLQNYQMQTQDDGIGILCSYNGKFNIVTADNPVDTCYKMILKLYTNKIK